MSHLKTTHVFLFLFLFAGLVAIRTGWAQTYTVLYSFTGGADGALPEGKLIMDTAGNLYGTSEGNRTGTTQGSVFKLSPSGMFTLLHNFGTGGAGGARPYAGLARDSAGNLYGTTFSGGASNAGAVFKLDNKDNFSVLYSFTGKADGGGPLAPLILDPAGNLYGTTFDGGSPSCGDCGVVFKLDTKGNETVLHTFARPRYGEFPYAGLLRDAAGNLYGTTTGGGRGGAGIVFKLDAADTETVLYTFPNKAAGRDPWSTLIEDAAGNFYGTTTTGGKGNCGGEACGVVFKLDTNGNETVLYTFTGKTDGGTPAAGLVMDSAGNLYGTAFIGGAGYGVVFKVDPLGKETVLYAFGGGADGGHPYGGLTIDSAGNLYGTAGGGGLFDCQNGSGCGVVFKITP